MFCRNCGTQLKEGAKFCPNCGAPAPGQEFHAQQQNPANGMQQTQNPVSPGSGKPRRSKKKIVIPIVAAAALLVVSIGAFAMTRSNFFKSKFSDPVDYYQSVEQAYIDKNLDALENIVEEQPTSSEITMNVELEDAGLALIGMTGYDAEDAVKALNNTELQLRSGEKEGLFGGELGLYSEGERLLSLNSIADTENDELYVQIPELSPGYLYADSQSLSDMGISSLSSVTDVPDAGKLPKIVSTYTNIMLNYVTDVKREDTEISVGGIKEEAILLTVTMDGPQIQDMLTEMLETLQDDEDLKDYIVWLGDYLITAGSSYSYSGYENGEQVYDSFVGELDTRMEFLKENDSFDSVGLEMEVWVNSDGEIIGRTLTASEDGEDLEVFHSLTAKEGDEYASELSFGDPDDEYSYILVEGNGTIDKNLADGTFTLTSYGEAIGEIEVRNFDLKAAEDGFLNGTFTLSSDADPSLVGYGLEITTESDKDSSRNSIAILSGGVAIATLNLDIANDSDYTPEIPDDADLYNMSDYEDLNDYENSMDLEGLEEKLMGNPLFSLFLEEIEGSYDDIYGYDTYNYDDYDYNYYDLDDYDFYDYY